MENNFRPGPVAKLTNGMYVMMFRVMNTHAYYSCLLWHTRLAHTNIQYIRQSVKEDAVAGIAMKDLEVKIRCDPCHLAKDKRLSLYSSERVTECLPGEIIHCDVSGPHVKSLGGNHNLLLHKDEDTGFRSIYFQTTKESTFKNIIACLTFMETQTGRRARFLKSDNGTEICNKKMADYLRDKGMGHVRSAPYTQAQNGCIEREMQTLKDTARANLIESGLPKFFWGKPWPLQFSYIIACWTNKVQKL